MPNIERTLEAGHGKIVLVILLLLGAAFSTAFAHGEALEVAHEAVQSWQAGKYASDPSKMLGKTLEETLRNIVRAQAFLPPPGGLEVNLDSPQETETARGSMVSFPASTGSVSGEVRVLVRAGEAKSVSWLPSGGLLPWWITSPVMWILFGLVSLLWIAGIRRAGLLRDWWREGWELVREYWRWYLGLNVLLYGLFGLGMVTAYSYPGIAKLMQDLIAETLNQIGIGGTGPLNPWELALTIFFWNFSRGLLATTALPGMLFGFPALLVNLLRNFVVGFALSPALVPGGNLLAHLPTIVIELQGYILGTFGAMVLLFKLLRGARYRDGVKALTRTVYLGAFFLMVAAWYEAFAIVLLAKP